MHPLENLKYVVIDYVTTHPLVMLTVIVGALIMLSGMGQVNRGEKYLDEARANRGSRRVVLGVVIVIIGLIPTGALNPFVEAILFWIS